ncbi:serine/arginine-rich splicing factor 5-like [Dendronephthya gigantea]|uniref:serine/arginine-rich splicing factor 5-like n=1 Tax=Dendronephthya gigantea TaxID=151771 RepID=UPI00106A705B|nr:serine/arginine-rich splicing factor 5-like [Dendronephthya gigantea]
MSYRVYFGRLPESLSQDEFEKLLAEHGKARNIEWKSGYAYVDYKHSSDASKTVLNLNGKEVGGNNILVELAQNGAGGGYAVSGSFAPRPFVKPPLPRPIRTPHRVRIENLSSRAKWMELKELLSLAGEVTFADTHKRVTGEGIVEFATRKDMDEAIKTFHNTSFYGKTIKLYDESPRSRSRSPSDKKSRSHSRHRSTEKKRHSHSRSTSPRRKSTSSRRRSRSPRRKSRRSHSRDRNRSPKRRGSRSRTPKRNSHKKSKRHSSPYSKSPRRNKHKRSRSSSHSNSDNNNDSKRKSRTKGKKKHSSDTSCSDSSDSD